MDYHRLDLPALINLLRLLRHVTVFRATHELIGKYTVSLSRTLIGSGIWRAMGNAWCRQVDHLLLPTVRIRDLNTGETFAVYSCAFEYDPLNSADGEAR